MSVCDILAARSFGKQRKAGAEVCPFPAESLTTGQRYISTRQAG